MRTGSTVFGECEKRCWRWLFGNKIPVSLLQAHGPIRSEQTRIIVISRQDIVSPCAQKLQTQTKHGSRKRKPVHDRHNPVFHLGGSHRSLCPWFPGRRSRSAGWAACNDAVRAGSYLRLIDSCITHLKARGPSRTCNEREEEEDEGSATQAGSDESHSRAGSWRAQVIFVY